MAAAVLSLLIFLESLLALVLPHNTVESFGDFSVLDFDFGSFDYSPPPPPLPPPAPSLPSVTCEDDLKGIGSLNDSCKLTTDLDFKKDIYIEGTGNLDVLAGVTVRCAVRGCSVTVNISGGFTLGENSSLAAGFVSVEAANLTLHDGSAINTTALGGDPPPQTSGTPLGVDGAGGGHGGRGACCLNDKHKLQEDVWGGDSYAWSSLANPSSYGSRGGTTSREEDFGGGGGGHIHLAVKDILEINGTVSAEGGEGGLKGGGGSGGSIYIVALKMKGSGKISASGGNGLAGGGGGRIAIDIFSRHDDPKITVHGGRSYGCEENSGAAGTLFDAVLRSLTVSNHNMSTETDTVLLEFPNQPLWTNVYVRNHAKVVVPLRWSRVQVRGQLSLLCGGILTFGLAHYPFSEFELMAEELLMSDSVIKVYGALRMSVKVLLMWNSKMQIDGGGESFVATSLLEASNYVVLRESSSIHSNSNLGIHGQGLLNLSGPGDLIEAQRLILSLFYSVHIGPGSILRAPLENSTEEYMTPRLYCDRKDCPTELLHPPEDCNVNSSLSFTLQVCRVEDITVAGLIKGSVVHFHRARNVIVDTSGAISASALGCRGGIGRGMVLSNGVSGGGGHGGKGGDGYFNGSFVSGGLAYGSAKLPCELGSGSGNDTLAGSTAGGGIIVMGSLEHSVTSLSVYGSVEVDGESCRETENSSNVGPGGGSGGTILLFLHALTLGDNSVLSSAGGHGSQNGGGGGGGGRIHFGWSNIPTGDEYLPVASVEGRIQTQGGIGRNQGLPGENGTMTGRDCPKGLYGTFCVECPTGTFKNVSGSDKALCHLCPTYQLPHRAQYIYVRGGVSETPCPYECISERYHMPHCYTALEELVYTFGGPWLFGLLLSGLLVLLALVLSVARMKFVGTDDLPGPAPTQQGSQIDHSFPFLESLNEVLETNRVEESQSHVHRMYFMGPNTFTEPWHLRHSPPNQISEIVYEDAFNRFVDEINALAAYQWWEGSVYSILCVIAYPVAWTWQQWCRKKKLQRLREFVRSEYDHSCLRSCRSRALYEGLKVAATPDLMLGYVDFFLGGDEKRPDLPPRLHQRFPMQLIFGGDGSYMVPFSLHSDNVLTSLMSQAVPPTIWYRLVAGLNAVLRLVRQGKLKDTLLPVVQWLETHANPALSMHGIWVDLACLQTTRCGYRQFGLIVSTSETSESPTVDNITGLSKIDQRFSQYSIQSDGSHDRLSSENMPLFDNRCGILDTSSLHVFEEKRYIFYPFSLFVRNTKPGGHQDVVGLLISVLLLGDVTLALLTLLLLYSMSLGCFMLVLFILPLGIVLPFPAGINALFSHGPRRSAGLARVYALWNVTSLINVVVAFICGFLHYRTQPSRGHTNFQPWSFSMDESGWWLFPTALVVCKCIQARLIDWHVANLEIQDRSLYSNDPSVFWQS